METGPSVQFTQEEEFHVKHKLSWTQPPHELDYNPLLATMIEGLRETQHPYTWIVRQGLEELLDAPGAAEKVRGVLPAVVAPLRAALGVKDKTSFATALNTLTRIAALAGPDLLPYLPTLIPPIGIRVLCADSRERVYDALRTMELACGDGASKIIQ
ncbi:hypothetical protein HK104_007109 [Borealophlyctis nickersoniae]|nr:hypothetical protein HK104_007109 [Borealophlyctis nickersoniae]